MRSLKNYFLCFSKISRYSPSESTKLYDKAMQRRTNTANFNPKATIALLKEGSRIDNQLNEQEKRVLIDRYLEVKLIIKSQVYFMFKIIFF